MGYGYQSKGSKFRRGQAPEEYDDNGHHMCGCYYDETQSMKVIGQLLVATMGAFAPGTAHVVDYSWRPMINEPPPFRGL